MKNIPSKEEVIGYLKSGKKLIAISVGGFIVLYALLLAYSLYSTFVELRDVEELYLSQEEIVEILDREPEEVTAAEIREIEEALEQDRFAFGVLIEREDQTFYNYPQLLTELLISEEVVSHVEEAIGQEILPNPELAVEVYEDSSTRIQEVVIGTADVEDNLLISQAYYDAIQEEGLIPPLDDKLIFMMDNEPFLIEEETWLDLVMVQIQYFSPIRAAVGFIVMLTLGVLAGVVLVLFKTVFQKEIPFMYELKEDESDKVIYFTQIRGVKEEEQFAKLSHAIVAYPEKRKLVLTQYDLNDRFADRLHEKSSVEAGKGSPVIANDLEEVSVDHVFDEVIILVQQNKTSKNWYKNQRIQLKRLDLPVTVLNY